MGNNSIFAEIFGSVSSSTTTGREKSVYKKEVYDNLLQSDRKVFRSKARKVLDVFLSKYLSNKNNPQALQELKKEWDAYAPKVYESVKCIYAGSDVAQAKRCSDFVNAMEGQNNTSATGKSKNK